MFSTYHDELMKRAAAQILLQHQNSRGIPNPNVSESTIDVLSQVTQLYITKLATQAREIAEISGRTIPNAYDVIQTMDENFIDLDELKRFANQSIKRSKQLPIYGVMETDKDDKTDDLSDFEILEFRKINRSTDLNIIEEVVFEEKKNPLGSNESLNDEESDLKNSLIPIETPNESLEPFLPKDKAEPLQNKTELDKNSKLTRVSTPISAVSQLPHLRVKRQNSILLKRLPFKVGNNPNSQSSIEPEKIWESLMQRREELTKEVANNGIAEVVQHDKAYKQASRGFKEESTDLEKIIAAGPFDKFLNSIEPPMTNPATTGDDISTFQTPIKKVFNEAAITSAQAKFTVVSQKLNPDQFDLTEDAPFPSWLTPEEIKKLKPPTPKPQLRIIAKVAPPPEEEKKKSFKILLKPLQDGEKVNTKAKPTKKSNITLLGLHLGSNKSNIDRKGSNLNRPSKLSSKLTTYSKSGIPSKFNKDSYHSNNFNQKIKHSINKGKEFNNDYHRSHNDRNRMKDIKYENKSNLEDEEIQISSSTSPESSPSKNKESLPDRIVSPNSNKNKLNNKTKSKVRFNLNSENNEVILKSPTQAKNIRRPSILINKAGKQQNNLKSKIPNSPIISSSSSTSPEHSIEIDKPMQKITLKLNLGNNENNNKNNSEPKLTLKLNTPSYNNNNNNSNNSNNNNNNNNNNEFGMNNRRPILNFNQGYENKEREVINCFCDKPDLDDGLFMVACDKCDQWFHGLCVNIQQDTLKEDKWYCDRCIRRKRRLEKKQIRKEEREGDREFSISNKRNKSNYY